jgi:hypothetical protein
MRTASLLSVAAIALVAGCASQTSQSSPATSAAALPLPADGRAVLERMHDRYATTWYHTLTFVQRTTRHMPDGTTQVSTWYEAMKGPRLRIDMGDPGQGNGALYTADSVYVMRGGKVARAIADGNPFLPLISGVYQQPLDVTVAQLAPYKVNLSAVHEREWEGKRTFVVGASSPADSTSPQFWVEADRLIVTRFLLPLFPTPDNHVQDARLENNVPVGGGWLATRVRMLDRGVPAQTEEYSDWHAGMSLADALFQAEHWMDAPHWSAPRAP